MSANLILLVIVSVLFWLGFWFRSVWYWLPVAFFGIMIDWLRTVPRAFDRASEADVLWLIACNILMAILIAQTYELGEIWRDFLRYRQEKYDDGSVDEPR